MYATIGSICLAICMLPEAFKTIRDKTCTIGYPMLLLCFIGEISYVIFAISTKQYVLLLNYLANLAVICIMLFYKLKTKGENEVIILLLAKGTSLDNDDRTMLH